MWKRPSEELPECYVGDRVIGIVRCREREDRPLRPKIVILEALEDCWYSEYGWDIHDCEWWCLEKDLVKEVMG